MRRPWIAIAALFLAGSVPAGAGVLYVAVPPLEAEQSIELQAFNRGADASRRFQARLLPLNTDGTIDRRGLKVTAVTVAPLANRSVVLDAATQPGLLEIFSAPQLSFEARFFSSPATRVAASLPVISSANQVKAGESAELIGLQRSGDGLGADVGVVNLGHAAAACTASLHAAGGAAIGNPASLALAPLSHVYFTDALAAFGAADIAAASLRLSCNQAFFTYASVMDADSGARSFVTPAARGNSSLKLPGTGPVVPPGAVVFSRPEAFHTPTLAKPTEVFNIPVPSGKPFRQLHVAFDYYHAGWSHEPDKNHNLFWVHRGVWLNSPWADNIYAFVNAFGPGTDLVKMLTNVDAGKARQVWSYAYQMQAGHTYRVEYLYDVEQEVVRLKLTDKATGELVVDILGDTYGKPIVADASGTFFVYFGHQDDTGIAPERPSYGSTWSALEVLFLP